MDSKKYAESLYSLKECLQNLQEVAAGELVQDVEKLQKQARSKLLRVQALQLLTLGNTNLL